MRRLFLLSLFATCWVQTVHAQVDVGYPNTAIGDSPYFGMDAPDQDRSSFHLSLGTTYHAKPLIFVGRNDDTIVAIDQRLLSILSTSIRLHTGIHLLVQGRLLTHQSGDGAGPALPLSKEVVFGRTRLGLKYSGTSSNNRTRWAMQTILATPSQTKDPLFGGAGYQPSFGFLLSHQIDGTQVALNTIYQHRPSRSVGSLTEAPRLGIELGMSQRLGNRVEWLLENHYNRQTSTSPEDSLRIDSGFALSLNESVRSKIGGGLGILRGIGTPKYTFFFALELHPGSRSTSEIKPPAAAPAIIATTPTPALPAPSGLGRNDSDADGLSDMVDECPLLAEDIDNFLDQDGCPDPDNDHDGYADVEDQSPTQPEDFDGFEDHDGIPEPDNDQDGLSDGVDRCPKHPGLGDGCPESTFDWRDYVARTDRTVPAILKSGDVLHLFRATDSSERDDMLLEKAAEWLQANHEWSRMNVIVSYCSGSDADKTEAARTLARRLSRDLTELGISKARIGFLSTSRYRTPDDNCALDVRIKRLHSFEGLGNQLEDTADGTPTSEQQILNVSFVPNGADPTAQTARALISFAKRMKRQARPFVVEVHTDALGSADKKLKLSQQRAAKLSELLQYLGLSETQFSCVGKGGSEPIGDNRTVKGRQQNNRVIVVFLDVMEGDI